MVTDKNRKFHANLLYDTFNSFRNEKLVRVDKEYQDAVMKMYWVGTSLIRIDIRFKEED